MNHYDASTFAHVVGKFAVYEKMFAALRPAIVSPAASGLKNFLAHLTKTSRLMKKQEMDIGATRMLQIRKFAKQPTRFAAALEVEARNARSSVIDELKLRRFLRVSDDRADYLDSKELFGREVTRKFPKASDDIREAGNCLAAECNTAAVFHLMRAFEWALRTLCADVGLTRFKDWDGKETRFKYTPQSFVTWEKTLNHLPGKFRKKLERLSKAPLRQKREEYYNSVYDDIKAVKDAWRNHVMHTRKEFQRDEAEALYGRVKDMMVRMASRP